MLSAPTTDSAQSHKPPVQRSTVQARQHLRARVSLARPSSVAPATVGPAGLVGLRRRGGRACDCACEDDRPLGCRSRRGRPVLRCQLQRLGLSLPTCCREVYGRRSTVRKLRLQVMQAGGWMYVWGTDICAKRKNDSVRWFEIFWTRLPRLATLSLEDYVEADNPATDDAGPRAPAHRPFDCPGQIKYSSRTGSASRRAGRRSVDHAKGHG